MDPYLSRVPKDSLSSVVSLAYIFLFFSPNPPEKYGWHVSLIQVTMEQSKLFCSLWQDKILPWLLTATFYDVGWIREGTIRDILL